VTLVITDTLIAVFTYLLTYLHFWFIKAKFHWDEFLLTSP